MAMASAGTGLLALAAIGVGAFSAAGVLLVLALGSGLYARHWISLAGRSRVGARSEDEVRRALEHLQAEGWRLRHSLPWRGRGDIDSLAIAPTRVAFAIETKTMSFDDRHLSRVRDQAIVAAPASSKPTNAWAPARVWDIDLLSPLKVGRQGIEPRTPGLKARCSAN